MNRELAEKLYNLCQDMDFANYADFTEKDIQNLAIELEGIQNTALYKCLEIIADI